MKEIIRYFNHPLLKWSLGFGLLAGLLCFGYFLCLYALGITPLGNHKALDFGIHIIVMAAAVWYYRRQVGHGLLHLWEALTICYVINTVGAILTGWLIYFFVEYVDPGIFSQYLSDMRNLIVSTKGELMKKLGKAEYENLLRGVDQIRPADLISDELSKKTVLAVLPVLIISLLLRRQEVTLQNHS